MNYRDLITAILIALFTLLAANEWADKHYILSIITFVVIASYIRDVINYELKELINN